MDQEFGMLLPGKFPGPLDSLLLSVKRSGRSYATRPSHSPSALRRHDMLITFPGHLFPQKVASSYLSKQNRTRS